MSNPYAAPSNCERPANCVEIRQPRNVSRGVLFGLGGYFAPFLILMPMFCINHGLYPIGAMINGLASWHWPVTASGYALLIPNFACPVFFGSFGYSRPSLLPFLNRNDGRFFLGLATLVGYFRMLVLMYVFQPLPSGWSSEITNLVESGFVMAFPISLQFYLFIRNGNASLTGQTTASTEGAEGS